MATKTKKINDKEPVLSFERPSAKKPKKALVVVGWILLIILILAAIGALVWSYFNYQDEQVRLKSNDNTSQATANELTNSNQPTATDEENKAQIGELLQKVAKHILLPEGTPQVATINDIDKLLVDQPFFTGAANGDKVIIYPQKAIIYSEVRDILINVGPVVNNTTATTTDQTTAQPLTLEIRNGTKVPNKADELKTKLEATKLYQVNKIANAAKTSYPQTILVNLQGKDVSALESELGVKAVTALPAGEAKSDAMVLIIIGNK